MVNQIANAIIYDANGRLIADPLLTVNGGGGALTPNVVSFVDVATSSTASNLPTATTTTVTITPSSDTAAIKISVSGVARSLNTSASGVNIFLFKDGVQLGNRLSYAEIASTGDVTTDAQIPASFIYLDIPGDTSPHTYTVYIANDDASTTVSWYGSAGNGVIIAEEVH